MKDIGKIVRIILFFFVPFICYYLAKKTDQKKYSWRDFFWIIIFSYLWIFLNIFVHECGHALTALIFGGVVKKISVGVGPTLFNLGGKGHTEINFQALPIDGFVITKTRGLNEWIIVLAMGVITQFLFLGLVYWLLKRNKNWQKTLIGHFVYHYAIKIAFWLTFVLNFPFVHPDSDWTKITKIIFGWK